MPATKGSVRFQLHALKALPGKLSISRAAEYLLLTRSAECNQFKKLEIRVPEVPPTSSMTCPVQ